MQVKALLEELNIPYWTEGKNVAKGNINIRCPLCGDKGNHGGISRTGKYSCWRCKGDRLQKILSLITNLPQSEIEMVLRRHSGNDWVQEEKEHKIELLKSIPGNDLMQMHKDYLYSRDLDAKYIAKKYRLKGTSWLDGTWKGGDYSYRIIIPVYDGDGSLSSFLARDITGKAELRYKNCPKDFGMPIKNFLYNEKEAMQSNTVFVCEGVFDLWKLDLPNAVATFGIELSAKQLTKLSGWDRVVFCFDAGNAERKIAKEYCMRLGAVGIECYVVNAQLVCEKKDLGDYSFAEIEKFRALLKDTFGECR